MNVIELQNISKSFGKPLSNKLFDAINLAFKQEKFDLQNVSKIFQKNISNNKIFDDITLVIKQGEFVHLKGKNGTGKTTLIKIMLGLSEPDEGQVRLFGYSPQKPESKLRLGAVLQDVKVPKKIKVNELVNLLRSYYQKAPSTEEILSRVDLKGKHDSWASTLSGGERQRLYFAIALAGDPELLILDEPTKELDTDGREEFWKQVENLANQGKTVLLVTHQESDCKKAEPLAHRTITLVMEDEDKPRQLNEQKMKELDTSQSKEETYQSYSSNIIPMLAEQTWVEFLQLLRTPSYLIGILIFSCLVLLFPNDEPISKLLMLVFFGAINLLIISIERFSKRVALERAEGWMNLLRVTPLLPSVYLSSKLIVSLFVSTVSLVLIFGLGAWHFQMELQTLWHLLPLFFALILGVLPFAIFGLALGYLIKPKSIDVIAGLLIPLVLMTSGIPIPNASQLIQNLIACSPFYHYGQLALWTAGIEEFQDHQVWLHLQWLIWTTCASGLIANWAYRRDQVAEQL